MKRFLLIYVVVYTVLAAAGLKLFRSPDFSREYLQQHASDHERFMHLSQDPSFEPFAQRPHLFPADDLRHEQLAFVQAYRTRPEYRAERLRIESFSLYFHVLNGVMFLVLVVRAGYGPAVAYLDKRIEQTRSHFDQAAHSRTAAMHRLAEVEAETGTWPQKEQDLERHAEDVINASLVQIREEARLARIQLARETEDRKRAEIFRAAAQIKEELVSEAIRTLEARYSTEATERALRQNVEQFVRLLELIT